MNNIEKEIKIHFVNGLIEIVLDEISKYPEIIVTEKGTDFLYIKFFENFGIMKNFRSILKVVLVVRDPKFNPLYISNHKSILGDLIKDVIDNSNKSYFKNFKITCAGSDSKEISEINEYVKETFKLTKSEEADAKIHIIKIDEVWEIGLQITARPLSVRDYKVRNMSGAMDPTVAFAMNYLCNLENAKNYLNAFSGSGTLLIEAGQRFSNLEKLIGFDNEKEHLSLSIQNIKKAGLIEKIQVKEFDIFDNPELGSFDVIVADLPFGMVISKDKDLENLYKTFVQYSENHLNSDGTLAVYTTEFDTFENALTDSRFKIIKKLKLKIVTTQELYLNTCIFICKM
ncbi:methyltransferase domain-containing protein [Candidatus Gracilibacteria bacterium]|nr:methyltransferase domain-containing protein [Candidatus Gracilibacteria bacterium]